MGFPDTWHAEHAVFWSWIGELLAGFAVALVTAFCDWKSHFVWNICRCYTAFS